MFPLKLETYLKSHVEETMNTKYGRKGFNLITLAVDKMQMEVRTTSSFIHLHVYVRFQNVSIICSKKIIKKQTNSLARQFQLSFKEYIHIHSEFFRPSVWVLWFQFAWRLEKRYILQLQLRRADLLLCGHDGERL